MLGLEPSRRGSEEVIVPPFHPHPVPSPCPILPSSIRPYVTPICLSSLLFNVFSLHVSLFLSLPPIFLPTSCLISFMFTPCTSSSSPCMSFSSASIYFIFLILPLCIFFTFFFLLSFHLHPIPAPCPILHLYCLLSLLSPSFSFLLVCSVSTSCLSLTPFSTSRLVSHLPFCHLYLPLLPSSSYLSGSVSSYASLLSTPFCHPYLPLLPFPSVISFICPYSSVSFTPLHPSFLSSHRSAVSRLPLVIPIFFNPFSPSLLSSYFFLSFSFSLLLSSISSIHHISPSAFSPSPTTYTLPSPLLLHSFLFTPFHNS